MAGLRQKFSLEQLALVARATEFSEEVVARHYRIPMLPSKLYPYEVVTLADQQRSERAARAFAQLLVYERLRLRDKEWLYRICLQDDVILRRASGEGIEWLTWVVTYVLTHELVHVVRFQRAEQLFELSSGARKREEDEVHRITLELLQRTGQRRWERLNQLYGNPVVPAQVVQG